MGALPSPLGRPRLREDVRFVPSPDGVYLHSDHGTCMLRGRHAHDLVSRLAPVLDGSRTLAELTARLPESQRSTVERLVRELVEHRMVVDDLPPSPHQLTETELSVYAQEIGFIGYALDSPERRFQRVRQSRTVLIGDGVTVAALVEALLGSGWRDLLIVTGEPAVLERIGWSGPAGVGRGGGWGVGVGGEVLPRCRRDAAQQVRVAPPGSDSAEPDGADLVITVASDPAELIDLCRTFAGSGAALAQALVRPDEAWLAPVGPPDSTGAESGWRRLAPGPDPSEDHLSGPVPAVIAAMMTLACFSHLTGLDELGPPDDPARAVLTRVDLRNLDTRAHRFLRHPLAGSPPAGPGGRAGADAVRTTVAALAGAAPLTAAEVLDRADSLVDARLGAIASLDEEALAQVPLSVCRARVRALAAGTPAWSPLPEVVGWGEDRRTARLRTLLAALAGYGYLATRAASASADRTWGIEIPDGATHAVPLHPAQPARGGRPEFPAGLGAGLTWDQAVAAGMRAHCEDLVDQRGTATCGPTVPLPDTYLARLVRAAKEPVEIRDVTGVLDVPAYSFLMPGELTVVSVAATAEAAMRDGMERLLLHWQSRTRRQSAYRRVRPRWYDLAPATAPQADAPTDAPNGPPDDPYGVRLLDRALRRCQQVPVAVPLHGDPEVARLVPHLVEVVLVRA